MQSMRSRIEGTGRRSWRHAALALTAALTVGWLGGGSCQASYCSEDCDPCVAHCRCSTSVCYQSSATFAATHALTEYTLDEAREEAGARRTFRDIVGLSVQRAGGSARPTADECVAFARGVLSVNAALFPCATEDDVPRATAEFVLDAALAFDGRWVVQMHREGIAARRAESRPVDVVTFLFDERGNLIEIDHAAVR